MVNSLDRQCIPDHGLRSRTIVRAYRHPGANANPHSYAYTDTQTDHAVMVLSNGSTSQLSLAQSTARLLNGKLRAMLE